MSHFDFMGRRRLWFSISAALLLPGLIAMIVSYSQFGAPVRLGIDFTGGTLAQLGFSRAVTADELRGTLAKAGFPEARVTLSDGQTALVRTKALTPPQRAALMQALRRDFGPTQAQRFESVGPAVGREQLDKALLALAVTLVGIAGYVALRYQLDFALAAIAAMAHDALFLIGTFALLGLGWAVEVDGLFVTAVLTVVGFSVHDTIVTFDRLRENMRKAGPREAFDDVANRSIRETFARSINTSLTVCLSLLAMALFGGEPVRWFTIAMLLGIAMGTYSSLFNASQLLGWWRMRGVVPERKSSPAV